VAAAPGLTSRILCSDEVPLSSGDRHGAELDGHQFAGLGASCHGAHLAAAPDPATLKMFGVPVLRD